jgi:hypothetical protein
MPHCVSHGLGGCCRHARVERTSHPPSHLPVRASVRFSASSYAPWRQPGLPAGWPGSKARTFLPFNDTPGSVGANPCCHAHCVKKPSPPAPGIRTGIKIEANCLVDISCTVNCLKGSGNLPGEALLPVELMSPRINIYCMHYKNGFST